MGATYHFKMEMVPKWKWCQAPLCRSSSLVVSLSRQCGAGHHFVSTFPFRFKILRCHADDEISYIIWHGRATPTSFGAAPVPEQLEAHAMPADDRLRLHNHQALLPVGETAKADCPKETISRPQFWPPSGPLKYGQLMAEHEILSEEGLVRPKGGEGQTDEKKNRMHSLPRGWRLDGLPTMVCFRPQRP